MRILLLMFALAGCGGETTRTEYVPIPSTGTTQPPTGGGSQNGKPSYQETQALLVTHCQQCHANATFMQSERQLRASSVLNRVRSRNMPPNGGNLSDAERRRIIAFF